MKLKLERKEIIILSLLLFSIFTFSIYIIFFVNLGAPFYFSFPEGNEEIKIRGLTSHIPSGAFQMPRLARLAGANFYQIKAFFMIKSNGECFTLPGQKAWLKDQIRKAHRAGLKVLLVPFGFLKGISMTSDIRLPRSLWDKFYSCFTKETLFWARFAQKEKVEMITTANEPYRFTNMKSMSKWLQEILPKLRKVYKGKIAVGFYPSLHNFVGEFRSGQKSEKDFEEILNLNVKGYDFLAPAGTPSGINSIEEMKKVNKEVLKRLKKIYDKWKIKFFFLEVNAPESTREEFWQTYLKKGMKRGEIRAMVFRKWAEDFKNISFVEGWFFIEWTPNSFLTFFETNPPDKKYTLGWQGSEVIRAIKEIYIK